MSNSISFESLAVGQKFSYSYGCNHTNMATKVDGDRMKLSSTNASYKWSSDGIDRVVTGLLDDNWKPTTTPVSGTPMTFESVAIGQRFDYTNSMGQFRARKISESAWKFTGSSASCEPNVPKDKWYCDSSRTITKVYPLEDTTAITFESLAVGQEFDYTTKGTSFHARKTDANGWLCLSGTKSFAYPFTSYHWNEVTSARVVTKVYPLADHVDDSTVGIVNNSSTNAPTTGDTPMPVFRVIATQSVTRKNDDDTLQKVERIVLNEGAVVAADSTSAAAIAGRKIATTITDEELSTVSVKVFGVDQ